MEYANCPGKIEIENLKENMNKMDQMVIRNFDTIYTRMEENKKEAKEDRLESQEKTDGKIDDVHKAVNKLADNMLKFIIGIITTALLALGGLGINAIVKAINGG